MGAARLAHHGLQSVTADLIPLCHRCPSPKSLLNSRRTPICRGFRSEATSQDFTGPDRCREWKAIDGCLGPLRYLL